MFELDTMYDDMVKNMGAPDLDIPLTAVKFYRGDDKVPKYARKYEPKGLTLTCCQACRQSSFGDAVCLTLDNIGCVAAAITFGFVGENQSTPLTGPRVYTDIMKKQLENGDMFSPPSPKEFTDGIVYAFRDAGRKDFALFGEKDCGRYKDVATAKQAIKEMTAIQPPDTKAVFMFSRNFEIKDIVPDVIVMNVRPVELTRIIQAYQYNTGKRVEASMGGLRAVDSDLIVRPYLEQKINISPYCLGARIIAQYEADLLGIGIPIKDFQEIVVGMKDSSTGFPFNLYPDAL